MSRKTMGRAGWHQAIGRNLSIADHLTLTSHDYHHHSFKMARFIDSANAITRPTVTHVGMTCSRITAAVVISMRISVAYWS